MICSECHRLDDAFTRHVQRSIHLLDRYRTAVANRDEKNIGQIQEMLSQEEDLRKMARLAIATHELAHSGEGLARGVAVLEGDGPFRAGTGSGIGLAHWGGLSERGRSAAALLCPVDRRS